MFNMWYVIANTTLFTPHIFKPNMCLKSTMTTLSQEPTYIAFIIYIKLYT